MRETTIREAGEDYTTGEILLSVHVGCKRFIFKKEDAAPFVAKYIADPEQVERDYYKKFGNPIEQQNRELEPPRTGRPLLEGEKVGDRMR